MVYKLVILKAMSGKIGKTKLLGNKKRRMNKVTKTAAKKRAYKYFQRFLRRLWTLKGTVPCYTCDKPLNYGLCQVGHWVTGHGNAVYINEEYVRPQCLRDNIMLGGLQGEFRDRLRKELGNEAVDTLLLKAKESVKISVSEYQALEEWYKNEYEKIK